MSAAPALGGFGRGKPVVRTVKEDAPGGFDGGFGGGAGGGPSDAGGGFGRRGFGGGGGFGVDGGDSFSGDRRGGYGGGGRGGLGCHKCGDEGHMARECTAQGGGGGSGGPRTCRKCNQVGHMARECPEGGGGGGFGSSDSGGGFGCGGGRGFGGGGPRTCRNCSEEGHIARDCPQEGGGGGRRNNCYKCGQEGHRASECTNAESGGGGGFGGFGGGFGANSGGGGFGGSNKENGGFGGGGFGGGGGGGFGGNGGSSKGCRKCGKEGHFARECPEGGGGQSDGCRRCQSKDHMVRDCPEPMKCFNCKEEGHQSKDCQNPRSAPTENGRKGPQTYIPKELTDDELANSERIPTGINFLKYDNVEVQVTGSGQGIIPIQTFEEAGLQAILVENVKRAKWDKPTPIQKYAIPIVMHGHDLMACAQTGSGKTAAYLLPILSAMMKRGEMTSQFSELQEPNAIILSPTRELAIQISQEARFFSRDSMARVCLIYGGTNVKAQVDLVQKGCNILVATPGRLNQFVAEGRIGLKKCRYVVLDEADRMLDMGFEGDVRKLVQDASMPLACERQTLMLSATFPAEIQRLALDFLRQQYAFITVGVVGGANMDITQEFEEVDAYAKKDRLEQLLRADINNSVPLEDGRYIKKTLVFVERKRVADFIASYLSQITIPSTSIHGDREQHQREEALRDFKNGKCPVLIATAVAARGLDIKGVDHVINYDLPNSVDDYVHRIGRTGRVGNIGRSTSFFDSKTDVPLAKSLLQIMGDAQQFVPEWLLAYGGAGGGGASSGAFANGGTGAGNGFGFNGNDWE